MAKDSPEDQQLHPSTLMIHTGLDRSPHCDLSEPLFLTQGFAYPTAEAAEARF